MRWMKAASVMVMLAMAGAALGGGTTQPAGKPIAPVTWATTMPVIELANQPLEKVLNELKQKLPGFEFSISREDVPHDYPVLPEMRVENVSLRDFAELLQQQIPGVSISLPITSNDYGFSSFQVAVTPNPNTPAAGVRIFGLTDIIAYRASLLKSDGDREKQATDDILSLIQAALDETDSSVKPQMKIHAPTQTLICKVTKDQANVIDQVLQSLRPTEAQLRQMEEMQQHQVLQEVEKINSDAANQPAAAATQPSK